MVAERQLSAIRGDKHERRAFDYFFRRISPVLSGALDAEFWRALVLQLSRSEPVMWYAVIAISSLFEHPQYSAAPPSECRYKPAVTDPHHRQALEWYNRSMSHFRNGMQQGSRTPSSALLSCILFICIELLQDNVAEAVALYKKGVMVLSSWSSSRDSGSYNSLGPSLVEDIIAPIFVRIGIRAGLGGQGLPQNVVDHGSDLSSLLDARARLYVLAADCHAFILLATSRKRTPGLDANAMSALITQQQDLESKLFQWQATFSKSIIAPGRARTLNETGLSSILLMVYGHLFIWLSTCLSLYESSFDHHLRLFETIVDHAEIGIASTASPDGSQPPFTFEIGVIPPLFFVSIKCRHPKLRRRAVSLLKKGPNMENIWKSIPTAKVAEKIIKLEEDGSGHNVSSDWPPTGDIFPDESNRIHDQKTVEAVGQDGKQSTLLSFARYHQNSNGQWQRTEHLASL
jgi:Fungal specific transcription factor domain